MQNLASVSPSSYNKDMSETAVSTIPQVDLGELFKEVELAMGYSPTQMAQAFGVAFQVYYRWRSGSTAPNGHCTAKLFLLIRNLEKQGKKIPITLK